MTDLIQVATTTATREEAERIAAKLVEIRHAACVQISGPITSVYCWQGKIETSQEWLCTAKTLRANFQAVESAIRALHSYDEPEILAVPVVEASDGYAKWVAAEVTNELMYAFRVHIHPQDSGATSGQAMAIDGRAVETLGISPAAAAAPPAVTFDQAVDILATLPRMFLELDGSLVWTGEQDGRAWQVDGVLHDGGPTLSHVELSGRCPPDEFDQFLAALGWPAAPLMFQLVPQGAFVCEQEFRKIAVC